jgi:tetratricopeptide (TPR) repeat protein
MQQFDEARQSFEKTVALLPTYTQAYYGLAVACTRLGRPDQARLYRERFEALKAKDQEMNRNRLRPSEEAASLQENLAPIYRAAAEAYQRHGELEESERLRRKAELLSPAEAGQ